MCREIFSVLIVRSMSSKVRGKLGDVLVRYHQDISLTAIQASMEFQFYRDEPILQVVV
jgi:hypothetical protein